MRSSRLTWEVNDMAVILELHDFHYYYGNIHVVKGIDIEVEKGGIVALIGANGAGKTTTLRTISGLTSASGVRGEIIYNGKKIQKLPGNKILKMGIAQVIEGRHIFSKLTVYENLITGAYCRKDKKTVKDDIKMMFNLFPRLEERQNQLGGTLSGGEQQMLAISRALVSRPEILLLDEPSLGIAPIVTKEIFESIKKIREEGMTILLVEQNSKIALSTADKGYVLQTGEIIMADKCVNLLANEDVQKAYLGIT